MPINLSYPHIQHHSPSYIISSLVGERGLLQLLRCYIHFFKEIAICEGSSSRLLEQQQKLCIGSEARGRYTASTFISDGNTFNGSSSNGGSCNSKPSKSHTSKSHTTNTPAQNPPSDRIVYAKPGLPTITLTPCSAPSTGPQPRHLDKRFLVPPRAARWAYAVETEKRGGKVGEARERKIKHRCGQKEKGRCGEWGLERGLVMTSL